MFNLVCMYMYQDPNMSIYSWLPDETSQTLACEKCDVTNNVNIR